MKEKIYYKVHIIDFIEMLLTIITFGLYIHNVIMFELVVVILLVMIYHSIFWDKLLRTK